MLDLTANSDETLEVCYLGKNKYDIPNIVSRISDIELIPKLQEMGIKVVQPELATAMALEGVIRYPTAFDVLLHNYEDIDVTEISVTKMQCHGTRLAGLAFPGDLIVLSLQRDGTIMIPHGDTVLQIQDCLGLIGRPDSIEEATAILQR